jgi:hypothetical protein
MKNKKIPQIKKNIKSFLNSEEGKITKENSLKLGSILGIVGLALGHTASAQPSCDHGSHSNHSSCCTGDYTSDDNPFNSDHDGTYCSSDDGIVNSGDDNTDYGSDNPSVDGTANGNHDGSVCPQNYDGYDGSYDSPDHTDYTDNGDNGADYGGDCLSYY